MRSSIPALFLSLTVLAGCEILGETSPEEAYGVRFRTPGTDQGYGATELPNGDLIVYGITEGRLAPTDGTDAYPLLLRLTPEGAVVDTTVYHDIGYGRVAGVVPLGDGLAVLTATDIPGNATRTVRLYETEGAGERQRILYSISGASPSGDGIIRTVDGGILISVYGLIKDAADLIKLDETGAEMWTFHMPGAQDVRGIAEAPNGDVFAIGPSEDGEGFVVARLSPEGAAHWQREFSDSVSLRRAAEIVAVDEGAAVLENRLARVNKDTVAVTRIGAEGNVLWSRAFASNGVHTSHNVYATALTSLPDGGLAFSFRQDQTEEFGGDRAEVVRLSEDGSVLWRRSFGPRRTGTSWVHHLLPLQDGRIAAAGSTGPLRLGGFGGDDFDVLVAFYEAE